MSKERNYLRRIIAFAIHTKPFREFTAGMNAIWAPSWAPPLPPPSFLFATNASLYHPFLTSSAAPPVAGLPLRDGAGEQRRGLHEEELPRDARLHEALQPAHHPGGRAHVEVRHVRRAGKKQSYAKSACIQVTAEAVCGCSRSFCFFSFLFFFPPLHNPPPARTPCITIPSTDSGSKYGRFVCADSKHLFPDDIDLNLGGFDFRLSEGACAGCTRRLFNLNKRKRYQSALPVHCFYLFISTTRRLP